MRIIGGLDALERSREESTLRRREESTSLGSPSTSRLRLLSSLPFPLSSLRAPLSLRRA